MEVPRHWREMPTNMSFTGREKTSKSSELVYFKYPGGSIPLVGTYEEIYSRFEEKNFKPEVIEEILFYLFGSVASETAIPVEEILECV